ncbi:undecaprenyl-diphosphatase [Poseidonocella pacifica]|uniref:Undecaprenyl-diphosphatase n=1 Tax=Poseidonocella pacifica TaxID=871651 RepID=A0A1I0WPF3_9RHOB|nr:undecaprenyl-diphosphate phosphatase [Poseidonocella pacifica]SFA90277.1 undecaprenyl-diphosphatase [Poseidonocella pacifica]
MPLLHLLLVAIIQGVTEFLPISSSGHLILLPTLTGMADQGLVVDVAVHLGTLGAVVLFFRQDVGRALRGFIALLSGRARTPEARLALGLVIATIPVVLAGLAIKVAGLDAGLRSVTVIAWTTLIFGLLLFWADQRGPEDRTAEDWTLRDAVIMGLWQTIALIPGTSRSGITITGARLLGYERSDAARLAMLMSIPTILASGALLSIDVAQQADLSIVRDAGIAAIFAFGAALGALALMMRLLRSVSFTPYVIYRVILGVGLLLYAYT